MANSTAKTEDQDRKLEQDRKAESDREAKLAKQVGTGQDKTADMSKFDSVVDKIRKASHERSRGKGPDNRDDKDRQSMQDKNKDLPKTGNIAADSPRNVEDAFQYPIVNEILGKIRSNYDLQGDLPTAISNVQRSEPHWPVELEPVMTELLQGFDIQQEGKDGVVHLGEPRPGEVKAGVAPNAQGTIADPNKRYPDKYDSTLVEAHPEDTSQPNPSTGQGQPKDPNTPKTVIKK
jgi:hypothetical protein